MMPPPESDPRLAQFAAEVGTTGPVAVRGGGTHWHIGGDVDPSARVINAPAGIVEVKTEEMIVEVGAGTLVSDLHDTLRPLGLRTALPETVGSTVGGAIAIGNSGIARLGRGQTRDAVLQIHFVSADGDLVTAGGQTVKNVSGFDLVRLLVGSLGTLGCMADMILRTQPIPEVEIWNRLDAADPAEVLPRCPTAASILWDGTTIWVLNAGYRPDVEADLASLTELGALTSEEPPEIPPNSWSRRPSEVSTLDPSDSDRLGRFIAEIGVGFVHTTQLIEPSVIAPEIAELQNRIKTAFDPTGRFNPGRLVGGR